MNIGIASTLIKFSIFFVIGEFTTTQISKMTALYVVYLWVYCHV